MGGMRKAAWLGGALLVLGCGGAQPQSMYVGASGRQVAITFAVDKYELGNGLGVVLAPDRRMPEVVVNVRYDVGSADDPKDAPGLAHLYEHLMFDGSRHAPKSFNTYLDAAGASVFNGTTTHDWTEYTETVPSSQLETMLWLESERLGFLDPPSKDKLDRERSIVEMERRMRTEEALRSRLWEKTYATMFPKAHPYHRPPGGYENSLDAVGGEDIAAFGKKFYVPRNAVLVLVGDFDADSAKAWIDRYFGTLAVGPKPSRPTDYPAANSAQRATMEAPVATPEIVFAWPTPPYGTPEDADLDVVARMLAGKLYEPLQKKKHIAQRYFAGQSSGRLGSVFFVYAKADQGVSLETLESELDQALEEFLGTPPTVSWIQGTQFAMMTDIYFGHESLELRAHSIGEQNALNAKPSYIQERLVRYRQVAVDGSRATTKRCLDPLRRITVVVRPNPNAPVAGKSGGAT
jgi:zinc protease